MSAADPAPVRVMLACSGLDHAHRGFESFATECFGALRGDGRLRLELVKGSGSEGDGERVVRTLTRDARLARLLGRIARREPFRIEQAAFALSLQPLLHRAAPEVVYFSEWLTGQLLARLRRATGARYRLAFCNGAMAQRGFGHLDLVQQLTPFALRHVLALGADPARQRMLPLGFAIPSRLRLVGDEERAARRAALGLPPDRPIVLSVAALNRHHKRIDYLIEEVARLPEPRPYLLLAGEREPETGGLLALARARLGDSGFSARTVAPGEVAELYRMADVCVLTSLGESFGRVLIEALAAGLPCIAHDYPITRDVLDDHGRLVDLSRPGGLAEVLGRLPDRRAGAVERHRYAHDRYSWEALTPAYVSFLAEAAGRSGAGAASGAANSTVSSSSGEKVCR